MVVSEDWGRVCHPRYRTEEVGKGSGWSQTCKWTTHCPGAPSGSPEPGEPQGRQHLSNLRPQYLPQKASSESLLEGVTSDLAPRGSGRIPGITAQYANKEHRLPFSKMFITNHQCRKTGAPQGMGVGLRKTRKSYIAVQLTQCQPTSPRIYEGHLMIQKHQPVSRHPSHTH